MWHSRISRRPTSHRDCAATSASRISRAPPGFDYPGKTVLSKPAAFRGESAAQHRLRAQDREKIRGCLDDMRPAPFTGSVQIGIAVFEDRGAGKIRALMAPFVKLLRAVVGLKKPAQVRQG